MRILRADVKDVLASRLLRAFDETIQAAERGVEGISVEQIIHYIEEIAVYWSGQLEHGGFWLIFILMAVESSVIPLPSEVVMLPAGALCTQGKLSLWSVVAAGTLGSLFGSLCCYFVAMYLGRAFLWHYGRYFFLPRDKFEWAEREWNRHGEVTIFVCRLLPVIRHLISIPAGLARMDVWKFSLWTTAGAGLWVLILTMTGYYLGEKALLWWEQWKREITIGMFVATGILVAVYVIRHRRRADSVVAEANTP